MPIDRRRFLSSASLALAGAMAGVRALAGDAKTGGLSQHRPAAVFDPTDWDAVRAQFELANDVIEMSALYVASHPQPVREAIEAHRAALDARPTDHLQGQVYRREDEVLAAAEQYLGLGPDGASRDEVALTDSTTMGLGLLYNGLRLRPSDEILTTEHDYYATHESVRLAAERSGATVRKIRLYDRIEALTAEEIVERVARAIRPATKVLAVTWVHSSTGLKIPLRAIAGIVERANESRGGRNGDDQLLLCVDGVHGFGVEGDDVRELGCDFLAAGCHKWLFGPRGTGILWGRQDAWPRTRPIVPSFMDPALWRAWFRDEEPNLPTTGRRMSPGGFKPFEHQWALPEAFRFHLAIGKERIAARTHELATRLKRGLAAMPHVQLVTPMAEELSSGIVCFDVDGLDAGATVRRMAEHRIVATVTPYATRHARLAPSIRNSFEEIDSVLEAVRALA